MAAIHQCLISLFLFLLQNATSASSLLIGHPYNNNSHSHFAKHPSHRPQPPHPVFPTNRSSCNLFTGEWVRDETYPLYKAEECGGGMIDPGFDCQTYGRPDSDYLKFRWQPFNCDVPRFNGVKFLERMRGKTIMFVGDSLGRNQWESLICMISSSTPLIHSHITRQDPLSTFNILEYNVKVSFYRAPYLVDIDNVHGKTTLKLDQISVDASDAWRTADVLLFNTGHWWTHTGSLRGWVQMETGGRYYADMDRLLALRKGLRTWSNWILRYINTPLTRVFFLSVSPTHYNPNEWTSRAKSTTTSQGGKSCYGQTTPYSGATTYPTNSYIDQKKVIDEIIKEMKFHVSLMDISMLSALRIDGHPSIYSGDLNPSLKRNPDRSSDCSHWCLPGLPDTWNQLVYADLLYSTFN